MRLLSCVKKQLVLAVRVQYWGVSAVSLYWLSSGERRVGECVVRGTSEESEIKFTR